MLDKAINLILGDVTPDQKKMLTRLTFRGLLLVHILWACGWLGMVGLTGFAQAGEVKQVKEELSKELGDVRNQVATVQNQVARSEKLTRRAALETEVRRLDQEIFNIQARQKELSQANMRPDRIYDERLAELTSERERVSQRLREFMRANPDIAELF